MIRANKTSQPSGLTGVLLACLLYTSTRHSSLQAVALIGVADTIKDGSAEAVAALRGMGLTVVMLTGDNEATAAAIGREAGIDRVLAGVLPGEKSSYVKQLQDEGLVEEVGRLEKPGRPILYGTTPDFLQTFGLDSVAQMPRLAQLIRIYEACLLYTSRCV